MQALCRQGVNKIVGCGWTPSFKEQYAKYLSQWKKQVTYLHISNSIFRMKGVTAQKLIFKFFLKHNQKNLT